MSVIKKPDLKIFAQDAKTGEIETFPDVLRGWGITLDRTAGKPPLEWFNAIGQRTDEWLMYLTQRGVAEWDATLSYPKTAIVQFNSVIYVSIKETKGEQPDKSQASWSTLAGFLGLDKLQPKGDYPTKSEMNTALAGKQNNSTLASWRYLAKGGEETIKPPYDFTHCLTFLNGLEQYVDYAFAIEKSTLYFAEPLKKDDLVEVLINVPLTSARVMNGDIQQQLEALELKVNSLSGKDFISDDIKNIVKSGSDDGIYLSENEIQKIESIDVETKDN
ncbi:hypothetical protein AB7W11_04805 [Providencia manganoxydans]|uniref:hypothetical protein n=1 Tax=Providencia manganoxydans TaxID=2923283 RepID=UPI0034E546AB